MMKTKIIAIVGPSGSGKTFMSSLLDDEYGIPQIQSRTTRPPRCDNERGHTFVTDDEFDSYDKDWMIAYTKYGDYRYCCLHQDIIAPVMSYVIDEDGLRYLKATFSHLYDIFSVRLFMSADKRISLVGKDRVTRDDDRFTMTYDEFDYIIDTSSFEDNPRKFCKMLIRMYQHFDTNP